MRDALERLRALAEKATPGPWKIDPACRPVGGDYWGIIWNGPTVVCCTGKYTHVRCHNYEGDTAYIAACSPEVVAAFVDLAVAADQTVNAPDVTGPGVLRDALAALRGALGA